MDEGTIAFLALHAVGSLLIAASLIKIAALMQIQWFRGREKKSILIKGSRTATPLLLGAIGFCSLTLIFAASLIVSGSIKATFELPRLINILILLSTSFLALIYLHDFNNRMKGGKK
ncbi:MAG: hypothetical protein V1847_03145 [Candidatus Diapherotrites archaeon]